MKKVKVISSAVLVTAVLSGCYTDPALTELAQAQGKQAVQLQEITKLIKEQHQQNARIKELFEITSKQSRNLKELFKTSSANAEILKTWSTESADNGDILQAALLLAKRGDNNISNQAITILGYIGGKQAEDFLVKKAKSDPNNSYQVLYSLSRMGSKQLRPIIIEYLKSGDTNKINNATNALNNNSQSIFTKKDVPFLEKIIEDMPVNYYNGSYYQRNNLIKLLLRLDQKKGIALVLEGLETAPSNRQAEYIYLVIHNNIYLKYKSWLKIIKALGEPNTQNQNAIQAVCNGIQRNPDTRFTDIVLPWADFAKLNSNFISNYVYMLKALNDPKAAKIMLSLCNKDSRFTNYLNNYPGIIKKNKEYVLVDNATMKKLMDTRNKAIARREKWEKEREQRKK